MSRFECRPGRWGSIPPLRNPARGSRVQLLRHVDPPACCTAPARVSKVTRQENERPRNVAILVDAMTVSAAEAFVLSAMRYTKVTVFGQPTGSSIDYQTVGTVRFGPAGAGLHLGYPLIVGSDRLPEGGVRPTGIVPDVLIDAAHPDPVRFIIEHYRQPE